MKTSDLDGYRLAGGTVIKEPDAETDPPPENPALPDVPVEHGKPGTIIFKITGSVNPELPTSEAVLAIKEALALLRCHGEVECRLVQDL